MDKKLVFRYLFEIIVIVFSVTLSFYIQEVLNDREKEELKNETLLGVIDDLGQTKFGFDQAQIYFNERIKRTEKIIETKKINSEDLLWVVQGWGWRVNAPSFESLINIFSLFPSLILFSTLLSNLTTIPPVSS